jgi:hypothetical protein
LIFDRSLTVAALLVNFLTGRFIGRGQKRRPSIITWMFTFDSKIRAVARRLSLVTRL